MADEAVTPASSPVPEPVNQPPEIPEVEGAAGSADVRPDIKFGQHLTWVPKEYNNATIVGYDQNRHMVRAVRRNGDSIETINIPEEKYKTLIETQAIADKAHGLKAKKNLSKAVSGYYGRTVAIEGKPTQIVGYDGSSDEVLINDDKGKRWIKSSDMLKGLNTLAKTETKTEKIKIVTEKAEAEVDKERSRQVNEAFQRGEVTVKDPPGQKTLGLTVDVDGRVYRRYETTESGAKGKAKIHFEIEGSESIPLESVLRPIVSQPGDTPPDDKLDVEATKKLRESWKKGDIRIGEIPGARVVDVYVDRDGRARAISTITEPSVYEINKPIPVQVRSRENKWVDMTGGGNLTGSLGIADTDISIRDIRKELAQARSSLSGAITAETAVTSSVGAASQAAIVATANFAITSLAGRVNQNQAKTVQINAQIGEIGGRISDIDRRIQQAPPDQVASLEREASSLQEQRRGLQNQLTTITVQMTNDRQTSDAIRNSLDQVASYPPEQAPPQVMSDLRSAIPPAASLPTATIKPVTEVVGAAAAAIRTPGARIPLSPAAKQFFDQNRPPTPQVGGSIPIQAVKPPLRALPDVSTEAQRATRLNRGQNLSRQQRRTERPTELGLSDALEEAMATEGALPGYSGVLDIPEGHAQSYAAGAKNEPEEADIYGKAEEDQRIRQATLNRRGAAFAPAAAPSDEYEVTEQGVEPEEGYFPPEEEAEEAPQVSQAEQAARFSALSSALAQSQMQEEEAAGEVKTKETLKEKTLAARRLVSRAVDVFDAAHGGVDGVGIVLLLLNENAKLLVTIFGADFYLLPKLSMPFEAGIVVLVDILVFALIVIVLMIFVIIIAALYSAAHPGEAALQALSDWLSGIF